MGNWNINIQGVGCHHNGKPDLDADLAAIEFVAKLRAQGHTVEAASFTSGSKLDLLEAAKPRTEQVSDVTINGRSKTVNPVLSYENLLDHLELTGTPSCTYSHARFGKQGILHPGESIEVIPGTRICMVHTNNA